MSGGWNNYKTDQKFKDMRAHDPAILRAGIERVLWAFEDSDDALVVLCKIERICKALLAGEEIT